MGITAFQRQGSARARLECGSSSFLSASHWSSSMKRRGILCVPARCCLVKTRLWKPARARLDESHSPSLALCCGQGSPQSCQVSHLESLSRFFASLVPARGQPQRGTEPCCSQGEVLQSNGSQGPLGVIGLSCSAAWHEGPAHQRTRSWRALFILARKY